MGQKSKTKPSGGSGGNGGSADRARQVFSRNMQLRVAAPGGADWEIMEAGPQQDGLLAAIRCLRGTAPDALALNAFAYAVPEGSRRSVEALCRQDWRSRALASIFTSVDAVSVTAPTRPGVARGCEVQVDGIMSENGKPVRMRERWVPDGARLLVLSAAGPPELFGAYARVIEVWLLTSTLGA